MAPPSRALNFCLALGGSRPVNPEWLEEQAIRIEDALIDRGRDLACGYSVTANFDAHGFEVDYTIETNNLSDAYERMSQIMRIIEETVGFSLEPAEATASASAAIPA